MTNSSFRGAVRALCCGVGCTIATIGLLLILPKSEPPQTADSGESSAPPVSPQTARSQSIRTVHARLAGRSESSGGVSASGASPSLHLDWEADCAPAAPPPPVEPDISLGIAGIGPADRSSRPVLFLDTPVAVPSMRLPVSLGPGIDDDPSQRHYERALKHFDAGDLQRARHHVDEAVRLNENHEDSLELQDRIAEAVRRQTHDDIRISESPPPDAVDLPTVKSRYDGVPILELLPPPGD
jgi:hypothetical protein